jgi:hypothetical protein
LKRIVNEDHNMAHKAGARASVISKKEQARLQEKGSKRRGLNSNGHFQKN